MLEEKKEGPNKKEREMARKLHQEAELPFPEVFKVKIFDKKQEIVIVSRFLAKKLLHKISQGGSGKDARIRYLYIVDLQGMQILISGEREAESWVDGGISPTVLDNAFQRRERRRSYTRTVCGKGHTHLAHIKTHERAHGGSKPYTCSACGKVFEVASNMGRHLTIHNQEGFGEGHDSELMRLEDGGLEEEQQEVGKSSNEGRYTNEDEDEGECNDEKDDNADTERGKDEEKESMEEVDKTVPEGRKNADDDILSFPTCWKEAEKVGWQKYNDRCSFKSVKEAKADETVPEGWEGSSHECPEGGRKFRHDGSLTRHMDYEEKAMGSDSDEETGVTETSINEKVVDDNLTS